MQNKPTILITGIAGKLGRFLVKKLHRDFHIIGLDRREAKGLPKDVEHIKIDIRRNRVEAIFRNNKIDAIIHFGVMHNLRQKEQEHHDFNIMGTSKLLEYAEKYQIKKFIFLSSINVYGPKSTNSQFLSEDEPLMAGAKFSAIRDLVNVDMLVASYFWKSPNIDIIILRAAHIIGLVNNALSNYLRFEKHLPTIMGFDPMIQVIHQDDLYQALLTVFKHKQIKGVFNIASKGELPLSELIKHLGKTSIPVPEFLFRAALSRLWNTKLASFPPNELDYIKYICMGDTKRSKEVLGFEAQYSIIDALNTLEGIIP